MAWNVSRLTNKQVAALAIVATLASALVAGVAALTVAFVEASSAERLAKQSAIRDYRRDFIKRPLELIEADCSLVQQVIVTYYSKDAQPIDALMTRNVSSVRESAVQRRLDGISPGVHQAKRELAQAIIEATQLLTALDDARKRGEGITDAQREQLVRTDARIDSSLADLRRGLEEFVFTR